MSIAVMKQALEVLSLELPMGSHLELKNSLRAAIEQAQEQETVMAEYKFQTYAAYKTEGEMKIGLVPDDAPLTLNGVPLYPHPRQWQGLTDEEIHEVVGKKWWDWEDLFDIEGFSRAIEAKLREKNR